MQFFLQFCRYNKQGSKEDHLESSEEEVIYASIIDTVVRNMTFFVNVLSPLV